MEEKKKSKCTDKMKNSFYIQCNNVADDQEWNDLLIKLSRASYCLSVAHVHCTCMWHCSSAGLHLAYLVGLQRPAYRFHCFTVNQRTLGLNTRKQLNTVHVCVCLRASGETLFDRRCRKSKKQIFDFHRGHSIVFFLLILEIQFHAHRSSPLAHRNT